MRDINQDMEIERREYIDPEDLNAQFHRIFEAIPAVELSLFGTILDDEESDPFDMTEDELFVYRDIENFVGTTFDPQSDEADLFARIAKGDALRKKRLNSPHADLVMAKLEPLLPHIKGTDSFKKYVAKEIHRYAINGIADRSKHHLYGDNRGGIFDQVLVEGIEERSLKILSGDINWYGVSPMMIRLFEADYENDPNYREMVDLARAWVGEFTERYNRAPRDARGGRIVIP